MNIILNTPVVGAVPFVLHAAAEGTYDTLVGLAKMPCAKGGVEQMFIGVNKIAAILPMSLF